MRDLALFAFLALIVIVSPKRPFYGALAWVLFGVMNPHRLAYGAAYSFPFAMVIAGITIIGLVITREHRSLKGGAAGVVLAIFMAWNVVTTLFAFNLEPSFEYLSKVLKVYGMTFVLMALMSTRKDVILLVSTLAVSLGFYGTKGGLFVLATGGSYMVNGPMGSVMEGNNSLGVGLTMVIPLLYFLLQQTTRRWLKGVLLGAMVLCAISILGAYSRGAMLAVAAMGVLLWLRGRNKTTVAVAAVALVMLAIPAMPERWFDKMNTLETYESDASAMFRLYAWETAYNIAKARFPVAGGFEWESPAASLRYSPLPTLVLVAHSIYFQVIGSQGFIGLLLFLTFWAMVWWQCGWLRRRCRGDPQLQWGFVLGSMVQVGLVGYFVGGAFLDLAFWDLPYYLYAAVVAARYAVEREIVANAKAVATSGTPQATQALTGAQPTTAGQAARQGQA